MSEGGGAVSTPFSLKNMFLCKNLESCLECSETQNIAKIFFLHLKAICYFYYFDWNVWNFEVFFPLNSFSSDFSD